MPGAAPVTRREERLLTIPNLLTLLRLMLIPVFVSASIAGLFEVALFAFVGAAITDAVDGWIARKYNQGSKLGALLDPAADKIMMICGYVVYTIPGIAPHKLPEWLTFTVFVRDLMIVLFAYLLFTRIRVRRFPPSVPGKTSTVLQVVALSLTIAANTFIAPFALELMDLAQRLALLITLYSGFDYLRQWNDYVLQQQN